MSNAHPFCPLRPFPLSACLGARRLSFPSSVEFLLFKFDLWVPKITLRYQKVSKRAEKGWNVYKLILSFSCKFFLFFLLFLFEAWDYSLSSIDWHVSFSLVAECRRGREGNLYNSRWICISISNWFLADLQRERRERMKMEVEPFFADESLMRLLCLWLVRLALTKHFLVSSAFLIYAEAAFPKRMSSFSSNSGRKRKSC